MTNTNEISTENGRFFVGNLELKGKASCKISFQQVTSERELRYAVTLSDSVLTSQRAHKLV